MVEISGTFQASSCKFQAYLPTEMTEGLSPRTVTDISVWMKNSYWTGRETDTVFPLFGGSAYQRPNSTAVVLGRGLEIYKTSYNWRIYVSSVLCEGTTTTVKTETLISEQGTASAGIKLLVPVVEI